MKYISLIIFALVLLASCETIEDRESLANSTAESVELSKVVVVNSVAGSNKVILTNDSKVGGRWVHDLGGSNRKNDTIIYPTLGEKKIEFYATTDAGIIKQEITITVSKIDTPLPAPYSYLVGSLGKGVTWEYATDDPYGNYWYMVDRTNWEGFWWAPGDDAMQDGASDEITFDYDGGAHFTLVEKDGDDSKKGTFNFNGSTMSLEISGIKFPDLYGNSADFAFDNKFEIKKITENELVIYFNGYVDAQTYGWVWRFKRKGYTFPTE